MAMIVERSMSDGWLTNTYLVAAGENSDAFLVDAGGPMEPLFAKAEELGLNVTHVLLTHHHGDHVSALGDTLERYPDATVLAHPDERVPGTTGDMHPGDELEIGGLTIKVLHTPGHTAGMLNLLVDDKELFTGDTLFKGSVGGVRAPAAPRSRTSSTRSWKCSSRSRRRPSCAPATPTRARSATSWSTTRSCAIWRGADEEGSEQCTALGDPATLVLWGPDYDGGHKAWVRWPDGRDDIVPGSKVER